MAGEGITDISNVGSGSGSGGSFNADSMADFLVKPDGETGDGITELTTEQITEQLTDIKGKDQSVLTDDEKAFLEKHDEKEVTIDDLKNKSVDQLTDEEKETLRVHNEKNTEETKIKAIQDKEESQRTDEEKQTLADYDEANKPPAVIEQIRERFGEVEGSFTDDLDGIVSLVEKLSETSGNEKANELLTKYPEVGQLLQHRVTGGSLDSFMKTVRTPDYSKVELSKEDIETSKDMYTTYLKSTGLSLSDISTLVQNAEDEGEDSLYNKAKAGQSSMVAIHNEQVAVEIEAEKKLQKENNDRETAYWGEVNGILKSGKLEGIVIPKDDLRTFEIAMKDRDDNQYTALDYDYAKLTTGQRMFLDYLVHKKFDVKGLNLQRKSTSTSLTNLLGTQDSSNKLGGDTSRGKGENFNIEDLKFKPSQLKVV